MALIWTAAQIGTFRADCSEYNLVGRSASRIARVQSDVTPEVSSARNLVSSVYSAHAGSRSPLLDGPWWLVVSIGGAVAVAIIWSGPLKWIALAILAFLFWLPLGYRWISAIWRSGSAFREGLRPR